MLLKTSQPTLKEGSAGTQVGILQQALIEAGAGIDAIETTNIIFGKSTTAAVKSYQQALGLDPDGIVGPKTWASLNGTAVDDAPQGWRLDAVVPDIRPVIDASLKFVGIVESPPASNRGPEIDKINIACGLPLGSPWCAAFATGMWMNCTLRPFKKPIGGVYSLREWAVKKKLLVPPTSVVQPGDLFLIIRGSGHGHTGIVTADMGSTFSTIEGNAGNACKKLIRSKNDTVGFVRPLGR